MRSRSSRLTVLCAMVACSPALGARTKERPMVPDGWPSHRAMTVIGPSVEIQGLGSQLADMCAMEVRLRGVRVPERKDLCVFIEERGLNESREFKPAFRKKVYELTGASCALILEISDLNEQSYTIGAGFLCLLGKARTVRLIGKVVDMRNGEVIVWCSGECTKTQTSLTVSRTERGGLRIDNLELQRSAYGRAAAEATERLVDQLMSLLPRVETELSKVHAQTLDLVIGGVPSHEAMQEIEAALRGVPGIEEVEHKGWTDQNQLLHVTITVPGEKELPDVSRMLTGSPNLAPFRLKVTAVENGGVTAMCQPEPIPAPSVAPSATPAPEPGLAVPAQQDDLVGPAVGTIGGDVGPTPADRKVVPVGAKPGPGHKSQSPLRYKPVRTTRR